MLAQGSGEVLSALRVGEDIHLRVIISPLASRHPCESVHLCVRPWIGATPRRLTFLHWPFALSNVLSSGRGAVYLGEIFNIGVVIAKGIVATHFL